jgi:hypothetical protein
MILSFHFPLMSPQAPYPACSHPRLSEYEPTNEGAGYFVPRRFVTAFFFQIWHKQLYTAASALSKSKTISVVPLFFFRLVEYEYEYDRARHFNLLASLMRLAVSLAGSITTGEERQFRACTVSRW